MTVLSVLDAAGRRRSPATLPGHHVGRPPRNKEMRYPADPPTVDEIVAVMRHTSDYRHGWRMRAMIVVLWRAGLRIQEALALAEHDLDQRRGSILVRHGKGGRRRDVGMDEWAGNSSGRGWPRASSCRSHQCSASSMAHPRATVGRAPPCAPSSAGSPPKQASGAALRRTSCATRTPSSSLARAFR
jgi:Phage integrase family